MSTSTSPWIPKVPNEIWLTILEYNIQASRKLMPTEKKASLSVESFAIYHPSPEDSQEVANFRFVCKSFAALGLECQFARVSIRFSHAGLDRLQQIASRNHLAGNVKQFSYMIPRSYPPQGRRRFEEIHEKVRTTTINLERQLHERLQAGGNQRPTANQLRKMLIRSKAEEAQIAKTSARSDNQRQIIDQGLDFEILSFALKKFKKLQQIRLMKVVDQVDDGWSNFLQSHTRYAADFLPFEWTDACDHAARTLTLAFLASNVEVSRLSSRFIDPTTPLILTPQFEATVLGVVSRLNSLELEFNNQRNVEDKVMELSALFHMVFTQAVSLQNLHVGFKILVSVPIEAVFNHIRLEKLNYIGLHMWEVESGELIDLLLRHRQIKYLRLRYIRLKEGTWARVLKEIRLNLKLKWISLRGICYPPNQELGGMHFAPNPQFAPILNGLHHNDSNDDSDLDDDHMDGPEDDHEDNEDDEDDEVTQNEENVHDNEGEEDEGMTRNEGSVHDNEEAGSVDDYSDSEDSSDDNESAYGHATHGGSASDSITLPHQPTPALAPLVPRCHCNSGFSWGALYDNGGQVEKVNWKYWQDWVLRRCDIHDPAAARDDWEFNSQ